ncbi:Nn.00g068350.m01.CDS01 [Neocucurbitaria sp. VM-36]
MTLPLELQTSYLASDQYPENLIPSGTATYRSKLISYKRRLDDAESDLCLIYGEDDVDDIFEIPMIDLETGDGKVLDKRNIHTPAKLTQWLGVDFVVDSTDPNLQHVIARKRDPKCRFIYFYGQNSRDKLKTTRGSLTQIMTYHQVMPVYMDFMLVFGAQSDAKDLRFSGFREQVRLKTPPSSQSIPALGRSGKVFQLCYNLKGVQFKKQSNENIKLDEWSIRQAAVYHQFDVEYGTTLWIVTKGGEDILDRYKELTGPNGRTEDRTFSDPASCFRSSLSTHLLMCHWSTEDWRWYIRWLEEVLDHESGMAVDGLRGEGYAHKEYKPYHIQDLQHWQDKANEAVMVLEANAEILGSIRKFYWDLIARKDLPDTLKSACEDDLAVFFSQLDEIINDFHMQIARAKLLAHIISDRKELVLQHLQGQAAERTERLNRNLEREAVVMRIITIVTLLYLPATFVSTFFSTDVVKYQDQDETNAGPDGSFSALALKRWLQVTLPLTALTLFGAWSTYQIYDTSRGNSTFSERTKNTFQSLKSLGTSRHTEIASQDGSDPHDVSVWNSVGRYTRRAFRSAPDSMQWLQKGRSTLPLHGNTQTKNG